MEIKKLQEMLRNNHETMQDHQEWELMCETYISDVKNNFKHDHFKNIVVDYCNRYGIK